MVHAIHLRILAVICYYMAGGSVPLACVYFAAWAGADHGIVALADFIMRWVTNFCERGSVEANYHGRKPRMPPEVAKQCVVVLLAGYQQVVEVEERGMVREEVRQKYFRSVHDAVTRSPFLREQIEKYNITEATLLRNLQHVAPGLHKRHLNPRRTLKPQVMQARVALCQRLLQMSEKELERYLARIFWIDSKVFYIEPDSMSVWAPLDADMTVVDHRMPHSNKAQKRIHYYAAVNAVLGPVYIEFVTGTTGHEQDVMRPPWCMDPEGIKVYHEYQVGLRFKRIQPYLTLQSAAHVY